MVTNCTQLKKNKKNDAPMRSLILSRHNEFSGIIPFINFTNNPIHCCLFRTFNNYIIYTRVKNMHCTDE